MLSPGARWLELPAAFLTRSLAHHASYRAKLALGALSALVSILMLVLVGRVVSLAGSGFEERVGMSYAPYALSGALVHGLGMTALGAFRKAVRREQLQGTFEQLLASGRNPAAVVALAGGSEFALQALAYIALAVGAVLVIDARVPPAAVRAAALYVLGMAGTGLASAGVIVLSKEGEPIAWAFGILSGALGGVCFPQFLLPRWLAVASGVLPTTHALALVRAAFLGTAPPPGALASLGLFAALALFAGVLTLRWGIARARVAGTLARY